MIAVTAALIGMMVCGLRSAAAMAFVAVLLALTFALSALVAPVSWFDLLVVVLAYNSGIIATVLAVGVAMRLAKRTA